MEFACRFVYVAPSTNQKDTEGHNSNAQAIKRSALHPPLNKVRPRSPPPPPPPTPMRHQAPRSPHLVPRVSELTTQNKVVKRDTAQPSTNENAAFHLEASGGSASHATHHHLTSQKKGDFFSYEHPKLSHDIGLHCRDQDYSYTTLTESTGTTPSVQRPASAPPLPPRPSFMKLIPEYLALLPASSSSKKSSTSPLDFAPTADMSPLTGNPNVILVSLGKLISEKNVLLLEGEPTSCSHCGSILDSFYDNVVNICYFCQSWEPEPTPDVKPRCPPNGCQDSLFLLNPDEPLLSPADALLLFCIDISGSMRSTSKVVEGEELLYKSRLTFVQEAVLRCVEKLSKTQPHTKVGLITFNNQVILHGYEDFPSRFLCGSELIDVEYLKEAAFSFPSPPPLSWTRNCLQKEIKGLSEFGATALGPAALVAIAMASRQPGSKVIVCTDGKANTRLGNLEVEDKDARTPLTSTMFYQDLGEYAASQGVTVSVLSIEGTDCRLDELGRLADRAGGKVVIASPQKLHTEFDEFIENTTVATHCSVTLLLPKALSVRGEREAGHKGVRELGNVTADKEITFQFGPLEPNVGALALGSRVSIQLQLRFRQRNGQTVVRVMTSERDVTEDSSLALSALSLAIIALNSSQASAALAVRGRVIDARKEAETQRTLMERALEYNRSAKDNQTYIEWNKAMEPIHNSINDYMRRKAVISEAQSLTDKGAELLYGMKHGNRRSILLKQKY